MKRIEISKKMRKVILVAKLVVVCFIANVMCGCKICIFKVYEGGQK